MSPKYTAWLHDITAADWGVNMVWLTEEAPIHTFYPLTAEFYMTKTDRDTIAQVLSHPHIEDAQVVSRYQSIHDWQMADVLQIRVNPKKLQQTYHDLRQHWDPFLFNADLSLYQQFCFQTELFPYAYAEIEVERGKLKNNWQLLETYEQMDYRSVPFSPLWFHPTFEEPEFQRGKITEIRSCRSVVDEAEEVVVFQGSEDELLQDFCQYVQQVDPDILFTKGGDTFLPLMGQRASMNGLGYLRLGRGPRSLVNYTKRPTLPRGHTFVSYGRVYYSEHGVYTDGGRHHYDVGNSFMWGDGNIEGIHELVRLGCSDPQRIARGTIGTTLSAVQMRTAYLYKILIPMRKADAEAFRPAWTMMTDVGGLVFSPRVGWHRNVTEFDFLSMYPNIMVYRNVSPETVNCTCCPGKRPVPLTHHHVCVERPGLINLSLKNILNRRAYFKKHRHQQHYERRQQVLKWLLVCSFGYTGYRNARFGRIEAHEAISAFSRDALTQTQHIAADFGLQVLAGIVDSIWVQRPDKERLDEATIDQMLRRIEEVVDLPIEHAADYHWIVFLPRRHEPAIGVLNRYYGLRSDGTFKVRGIEIRQSSSPLICKKMQEEILHLLSKVRTRSQFRTQLRCAKKILQDYLDRLGSGDIPLEDLTISIRPSRSPEEYVSNTRTAIAALQLARSDVKVEAGMKLRYVILDAQAQDSMERVRPVQLLKGNEQYDVQEYQKLLKRTYENLIPPELEEKRQNLNQFF
ncbi:MAG: DNA polymerase domain-containing protein [Candidatus Thorarchaeota archaeon]